MKRQTPAEGLHVHDRHEHQARASPSGKAKIAVAAASKRMRSNSSCARRLRVTPTAQTGASCARRTFAESQQAREQ